MTTNQKFKNNIARFNKLQAALAEHGLEMSCGAVIDSNLPTPMPKVVCPNPVYKNIDLDTDIDLKDFAEIHAYINGGREKRIATYEKEQAEAKAFFANRV